MAGSVGDRLPIWGGWSVDRRTRACIVAPVIQSARAKAFLSQLTAPEAGRAPLGLDPEGFGAALAADPQALGEALMANADLAPAGPIFADARLVAAAVFDLHGRSAAADEAFERRFGGDALSETPRVEGLVYLHDRAGRAHPAALAAAGRAATWPLGPSIRAALARDPSLWVAVVHVAPSVVGAGEATARLLGLTGLERRVVEALVTTGDLRRAAGLAGVAYETARQAIKNAAARAGVRTQEALVSTWIRLQTGGDSPVSAYLEPFGRLHGLSERQTRIATLTAEGVGRDQVAATLGLSSHVVKTELKLVFAACGVTSVAGLAALVTRVRALTALTTATEITAETNDAEPLRLVSRGAGQGRIAVADHGPVGGRPVLILHTATTGRVQPQSFIQALQARGLRPIALDRPGFGLSDMVGGDYLDASADDLARVMDGLKLARACVLARGGTMVLARFMARHDARLERAVVINPEPSPAEDRRLEGMSGHVKRLVYGSPWLIEALAAHLARRAATPFLDALVTRALEASPADRATLSRPEFRTAYLRATQLSALQGGAGFVATALSEPRAQAPVAPGERVAILCGGEDPLYDPADTLPRWRAVWPGCSTEVVHGAGRLLHWQRPDLIADRLLA